MTKFRLSEDDDPGDLGNVYLDDDVHAAQDVSVTPTVTFFSRQVTGRDADGNREFEWIEWGTAKVISYVTFREMTEEVELMKVKATLLHDGTDLPSTAAARFSTDDGDVDLWRITAVNQVAGVSIEIEGERVL